jgi:hypothetical protein
MCTCPRVYPPHSSSARFHYVRRSALHPQLGHTHTCTYALMRVCPGPGPRPPEHEMLTARVHAYVTRAFPSDIWDLNSSNRSRDRPVSAAAGHWLELWSPSSSSNRCKSSLLHVAQAWSGLHPFSYPVTFGGGVLYRPPGVVKLTDPLRATSADGNSPYALGRAWQQFQVRVNSWHNWGGNPAMEHCRRPYWSRAAKPRYAKRAV